METVEVHFAIKELSLSELSTFFKENDNDYFEKLSDRVNIEEYSGKLLDSSVHFTLWNDKQLIGLSPCYFNNIKEKVGYISSLTIKNGFRRKNLGSEMITQIKEYAKKQGFQSVIVKIHLNNSISYQFYKKNGFTNFIEDEDNYFRLLRLEIE